MFADAKALLLIVSCALLVHAQSATSAAAVPTSTAGLDSCIVECLASASSSTGCAYTNLTCACTSSAFQQAAGLCLQTNCSAADAATASALQQTECASVTASSSAASTAAASTATSASASSTASSSSSSGAMVNTPMSFATLVGTLVVSAGALVGAALV